MFGKYSSYADKVSNVVNKFNGYSTDDLKDIIESFPEYTNQDVKELEELRLKDKSFNTKKEQEISTLRIHRNLFKRACDSARDFALDDNFIEEDREHCMRAIECFYIVKYINSELKKMK